MRKLICLTVVLTFGGAHSYAVINGIDNEDGIAKKVKLSKEDFELVSALDKETVLVVLSYKDRTVGWTGTLVGPRKQAVLTAAHFTRKDEYFMFQSEQEAKEAIESGSAEFAVIFKKPGVDKLTVERIRTVTNFALPKKFNFAKTMSENRSSDQMLLMLDEPAPKDYQSAEVETDPNFFKSENKDRMQYVFCGAGVQSVGGAANDRKVTFKWDQGANIVAAEAIEKTYRGLDLIAMDQAKGGACNGDSGGGLWSLNPITKQRKLVAIHSFGPSDCSHGIYTPVGNHLEWLQETYGKWFPADRNPFRK